VTETEMSTETTAPATRLRPRRSCLAVPGSNPRFLEKAQGLPARSPDSPLNSKFRPDSEPRPDLSRSHRL